MKALSTLAFLHAHGLAVEPAGLQDALRSAIAQLPAAFFAAPGAEGLSAVEVQALESGGFRPVAAPSPPGGALLAGAVRLAALIEGGLDTRAAAAQLGVSEARVRQRLGEERSLLGVKHRRGWRLPAFQFVPGGELPGWAVVCRVLPAGLSPVAVLGFMEAPQPELGGRSPLGWLGAGDDPAPVAALAAALT